MSSKAKSKQEEALQFLDNLDSFSPSPAGDRASSAPPTKEGEAEVLAFIDEITQKSSEPTRHTTVHLEKPLSRSSTPTLRKTTERVKLGGSAPSLLPSSSTSSLSRSASDHARQPQTTSATTSPAPAPVGGGWGWGSVWSSATTVIQQAKSVVDEQVRNMPKNEQARKWGEGVLEYAKNAQLDKLGNDFKRVGLSTLNDILNVVAPPISEHEVIHVWLTHDMEGYDGVESLVYRAFARVLEQIEGGDLVVNRGQESKPKDRKGGRDLNAVDGYEPALKLAQANIAEFIKMKAAQPPPKPSTLESPTTYSHIYMRIQPYFSTISVPAQPTSEDAPTNTELDSKQTLQFLLHLVDPAHKLAHTTVTQPIPSSWLAIWDDYDWAEDSVAEGIRVGAEVLSQEYLVARMGWAKEVEEQETDDQEEDEEEDDDEDEDEEEEEEQKKP